MRKYLGKIVSVIILCLFAVTITLTGSLASWASAGAASIITLLTVPSSMIKKNAFFLAIPIVVVVGVTIASFLPMSGISNPLYQKAKNFPRELQLPFTTSWKVSVSAFRDSPLWGTGPGSYLFDYTFYKPLEVNNTKLWNIRFNQAFNEYLQVLATLG